jgi:hypothetical protein
MMDVQTMLALIVLRAIVRRVVVVMMANLLIMVVVMSMMDMASLVMFMDVEQNPGERSGRGRVGHADDGGERKRDRHRPYEGDTASALSFESRQHAFLYLTLQVQRLHLGASGAQSVSLTEPRPRDAA